jgi:hypothetical protein
MSGTLLGPGAEIDGFVIESVAGRGGMGVVYRARQQRPDRIVALKVIAPDLAHDGAFRARFERESSIAAQIEHPNVIPVYAIGEADGVLYIAMRFVEGTDLRSLLDADGPVEPSRAATIVDRVGRALDAAHAQGLVHRDVKPANILLADAAGRDHVYLTDFGLSRHVHATSGPTRTGAFMGTIDYVAPEQARGERVDARADVYSLGCVLFTALTGAVPFDLDNDLAKLYAHDRSPAPSVLARNPDLPEAFETVLARALEKDPDERYQSAGDLGRAALAAAAGSPLPKTERLVAAGAAAPEDPEASEATTIERDPPAPPPPTRPAAAAGESTVFEPTTGQTGAASEETALESPTIERDEGPASAPAPPKRGRPRGLLIGAGVVVVGAVVAAIALGGGGDDGGGNGDKSGDSGGGGGAAATQTAAIPESNLTANPSFESDLSNWDNFNTKLARVEADDAPDGSAVAQVSLSGSQTEYAIDDSPDSVESSTAGSTYSAVAWVKATESTDGKPVCISIRERPAAGGGEAAGIATGEVTATAGEYQPVRVSYTAQADGNRIDVHVLRQGDGVQAGEAFLVDAISLIDGAGDDASPDCSL